MSDDVWLGVDVGTTGIRCVAFTSTLRVLASQYLESAPQYRAGGVVEQDPEDWVRGSLEVIAAVVANVPGGSRVRGLSLSTQSITVIPVNGDGAALRPAISWLDQRGEAMLPSLAQLMSPHEIRERTGKPWSGVYGLPKILWLQQHEPDVMQRCRWILGTMDYVLFRLTGRVATDHTLAGGTMLYNNALGDWDDLILERAGVARDLLPPIMDAGTLAGELSPGMAVQCGLPAGIPVAVGAQDQKCAALAAGLAPGTTTISLGTAAAIENLQCSSATIGAPDIATFSYLFPGTWVSEGVVATAGAAVRWFSRTAAPTPSLAALGKLAGNAAATVDGPLFLPLLSRVGVEADTKRWPTQPAGVFWGLTLDSHPGDLFRAVLEGVTFECALVLKRMGEPTDGSEGILRLFGGGATSPLWCQLFADVTQCAVEVPTTHETAAAGAALLAGMGAGAWGGGFAAAQRVSVAHTYEPTTGQSGILGEKLDRYQELRARLFS